MEARVDDRWIVDPLHDDQGVVINVKGKGLVVVGGCSHALYRVEGYQSLLSGDV